MKLVVGHGEIFPDAVGHALSSVRRPFMLVTMDALWWEVAAEAGTPRLWFKQKLALMQYVLGKDAICLMAMNDLSLDTISFNSTMYAMNVPIWEVA